MSNVLLIDVGNTTVDFRLHNKISNSIEKIARFSSKDNNKRTLEYVLFEIEKHNIEFDTILFVSVVPEWNDVIRQLGNELNKIVLSLRKDFIYDQDDFHVESIVSLGADFIANYYGVLATYDYKTSIVVSLGTATTFFVVHNNKFEGTAIAPGVTSSLNGLLSNTSLLKENKYRLSNKTLGGNTYDAISIGTVNGHWGMVHCMIDRIAKDFDYEQVIYTGGNMEYFQEEVLRDKHILNEELIFRGMIYILENLEQIKK